MLSVDRPSLMQLLFCLTYKVPKAIAWSLVSLDRVRFLSSDILLPINNIAFVVTFLVWPAVFAVATDIDNVHVAV